MKILFVTGNFHPEKTGIAVVATSTAKLFVEMGHQVSVVTSMPHYPEWQIHENYKNKFFVRELQQGLKISRVWLMVPKRVTTLGRLLHEITLSIGCFISAIMQKSDLIFCISPPLTLAFSISLAAKILHKPFYIYVNDIQPDTAITLKMLRNPILIKISQFLENFIYRAASKILVLSGSMLENITAKGISMSKLSILPFFIDADRFFENSSGNPSVAFRVKHGLEGKFIFLYSGNLGAKYDPGIVVRCAQAMAEYPNVFFAIVGDGALRSELEADIAKLNLNNIKLFPLCEEDELAEMLNSADCLLLPQRAEICDLVVPSKLLTYLASKTPVLVFADLASEVAKLLAKHDAAFVVQAKDLEAGVLAIKKIISDKEQGVIKSRNGFSLLKELYNKDSLKATVYQDLFNSSCK